MYNNEESDMSYWKTVISGYVVTKKLPTQAYNQALEVEVYNQLQDPALQLQGSMKAAGEEEFSAKVRKRDSEGGTWISEYN